MHNFAGVLREKRAPATSRVSHHADCGEQMALLCLLPQKLAYAKVIRRTARGALIVDSLDDATEKSLCSENGIFSAEMFLTWPRRCVYTASDYLCMMSCGCRGSAHQ